jgi:hypothetical protein
MNAPVEFALALSHSFPSGMGSYSYTGSFKILVQNLAYEKQVSIWAKVGTGWQDIGANYVQSLPGDLELWSAPANNSEGEFVARYAVSGTTYWDNNGYTNYKFPQAFDEFAALAGANYKVVLGSATLAASTLHVDLGVKNLAYDKVVGIMFTTDNWTTVQTAFGTYSSTMKSGLEVWHISVPVGSATEVRFAIFYRVAGSEYWDNNFWRNYKVTPSSPLQWGNAP